MPPLPTSPVCWSKGKRKSTEKAEDADEDIGQGQGQLVLDKGKEEIEDKEIPGLRLMTRR